MEDLTQTRVVFLLTFHLVNILSQSQSTFMNLFLTLLLAC